MSTIEFLHDEKMITGIDESDEDFIIVLILHCTKALVLRCASIIVPHTLTLY